MRARAYNLFWRVLPYLLAAILRIAYKRISESSNPKAEVRAISCDLAKMARTIVEPLYLEEKSVTDTKKTTAPAKTSTDVAEPVSDIPTPPSTKAKIGKGLVKVGGWAGNSLGMGIGIGVGLGVAKYVLDAIRD